MYVRITYAWWSCFTWQLKRVYKESAFHQCCKMERDALICAFVAMKLTKGSFRVSDHYTHNDLTLAADNVTEHRKHASPSDNDGCND